jgi:cob(I)alamin adenosyltransferase
VEAVYDVRAGFYENFVAAFEVGPTKVFSTEIFDLEVGAGGAVKDNDAVPHGREVPIAVRIEAGENRNNQGHGHQGYRAADSIRQVNIYTRKGDDGTTGLLYGGRVRKDSDPIEINGAVDEAQAALGLARAHGRADAELDEMLTRIERELYVLMAEIATLPENRDKLTFEVSMVSQGMVDRIEESIDQLATRVEMPTEFVVPGQNLTSAALDVARTAIRRAERLKVSYPIEGSFSGAYLNRLSDYVWMMARWQEGDEHVMAKGGRS